MKILLVLGVLVVLALVLLAAARKQSSVPGAEQAGPEFKASPLMTRPELKLFAQLTGLFPDVWVFPQVSMSALMNPTARKSEREKFHSALNKIVRKRVDFVVCRKDLSVVAVIELDDSSHDNARQKAADVARDALLGSVGVPVVRFDGRSWPSDAAVQDALIPYLNHTA